MEEVRKVGEMALKLERYRYRLTSSLAWIIFGMLFASTASLCNSLLLFGMPEWVWILLIPAGIAGAFIYRRFWAFIPVERKERRRWKTGVVLLCTPFLISYSILPFLFSFSPFYFSIVWYPSLGLGLLISGFHAKLREMVYAGIAMLLTSAVFLTVPKIPLAANLIGSAMMLLIYLAFFLHSFFRAQDEIYA